MNILTTSNTAQELYIIPRRYVELVDLYIFDENKRTTTEMSVTSSIHNGSMLIEETFDLEEGSFYTIRVKEGTEILYTGRVFCTDETELDEYQMTENQYTSSNETDGVIYIN